MRSSLTRACSTVVGALVAGALFGTTIDSAAGTTPTPRPRTHARRTKTPVRRTPSPTPATQSHVTRTITPPVPTSTPASTPTVDPNNLTAADKRVLAEMALQWAVDGGISDFKLVKDPENLIVSEANLSNKMELKLPDRVITVLSPSNVQERADKEGDFLYFRFGPFIGYRDTARLTITLVWAVSSRSEAQYLSGGGATLKFERREGKWTMLPVTNRWIS
jgi:hypothetical protein